MKLLPRLFVAGALALSVGLPAAAADAPTGPAATPAKKRPVPKREVKRAQPPSAQPGADRLAVSGNGASRVFYVTASTGSVPTARPPAAWP